MFEQMNVYAIHEVLHKVQKLESVNVRKVSMVNACIFDHDMLHKVIPKLGIVRFPLPCS